MKRFLLKLKKSLHNSGSSLILVIVSLAFVGIIVGALLTAVGYAYRQKLYDYNAKSNFYYLDQAMDEIYAGVGSQTVKSLTEAYEKTREEVIYFDKDSKAYKTMSDDEANNIFKNNFMSCFISSTNNDYWKDKAACINTTEYEKSVVYAMTKMITNSAVTLDEDAVDLVYVYMLDDGSTVERSQSDAALEVRQLSKIVLRNVKLTRTAEYNRSQAKGTFEQSISTDIEISRPDFAVNFGSNMADISTLFEYCMVADSGVDFDRITGDVLTISGNVYAASDFYNKSYNKYETDPNFVDSFTWDQGNAGSKTYKMNKVAKYSYTPNGHNLFNNGQIQSGRNTIIQNNTYDGNNERSKYSGFYIDGGKVNILADTMVVPGSIAVMNGGVLNVYGNTSADTSATNIWADEVVLGGYTLPGLTSDSGIGSSAIFNANMYVKDDTQLESDFTKFALTGTYYGFSNSESADSRKFIPTVAKGKSTDSANIYQREYKDSNNVTKVENRGHYNSSAIVINGENATLDLSKTSTIFIAGRAYIELSSAKTGKTQSTVDANKGKSDALNVDENKNTYIYDAQIQDYRTGESISIKSTQLAYYPSLASGAMNAAGTTFTLTSGTSGSSLINMRLFTKYFGTDGIIPIQKQETVLYEGTSNEKTKTYYYFDFEQAVLDQQYDLTVFTNDMMGLTGKNVANLTKDDVKDAADILKRQFIKDYCDFFNFCVDKNSQTKLDFMGYESDYDDSSKNGTIPLSMQDFALRYPDVDTSILDSTERTVIDRRAAELQNVTNYDSFKAADIQLPMYTPTAQSKAYGSGVLSQTDKEVIDEIINTTTNKYTLTYVRQENNTGIKSTLLGESENVENTNDTSSNIKVKNLASDYELHYNYLKYALKDVYSTGNGTVVSGEETEAQFLNKMIAANGESGISPINYYMNYDLLEAYSSDISPSNLDLGEYKVWASNGDVTVSGGTEVTGIVVAMGDVYFSGVKKFNGLIITGGKVYITTNNGDLANINSTSLCRNVINECISKASKYGDTDVNIDAEAKNAIKFLKLFKAYEDIATRAENGELASDSSIKEITSIDYSDVLRYNNWMRNVD